jgi:hypothetical protein
MERNPAVSRRTFSGPGSTTSGGVRSVHKWPERRIGFTIFTIHIIVFLGGRTLRFDDGGDVYHVAPRLIQVGLMAAVHGGDHRRAEGAGFALARHGDRPTQDVGVDLQPQTALRPTAAGVQALNFEPVSLEVVEDEARTASGAFVDAAKDVAGAVRQCEALSGQRLPCQ